MHITPTIYAKESLLSLISNSFSCILLFLFLFCIQYYGKAQNYIPLSESQFSSLPLSFRPNSSVYEIGENLLNKGLYDSAITVCQKASKTSSAANDFSTVIYSEWVLARAFGRKGKSEEMFNHFFIARQYAEQIDNDFWRGFIDLALGSMYFQINADDRAKFFLMQSLQTGINIGDSLMVSGARSGLAEIAGRMNDYATMIQLIKESIISIYPPKNSYSNFALGQLYHKLGLAYLGNRSLDSAKNILEKGIDIFHASENKRFIPDIFISLAKVQLAMKNKAEARVSLDSAEKYIKSMNLHIARIKLFNVKAMYFDSIGDYYSAYHYFRQYQTLKDSIFSTESAIRTEQLKNDFAQNLVEEKRKNMWILIFAIGLGLLVIIGILSYLYFVKRRDAQILLRQQNEIEKQSHTIQQVNKELELSNLELHKLNELKNTFLGIATHDLRNPLSRIIMMTDFLNKQFRALLEESDQKNLVLDFMQKIIETAEFMNHIIQDLLDINKIESGLIKPHIRDISLNILNNVASSFHSEAEKKNITLTILHVQNEIANIRVLADERILRQIFENLISNAIKYSPLGKTIRLRVETESNFTQIEIEDEGPGLTEEDSQKIFTKFARLSAKPTAGESSTGLGLAICKELAEQMNCFLGYRSVHGYGATFFLRVPRAIKS